MKNKRIYFNQMANMKRSMVMFSLMFAAILIISSCKENNIPAQVGQETIAADSVLKRSVLTGGEFGDVARGNVSIERIGNKRFLVFNNVMSNNGPDVHVYLSATVGSNAQPPTDYIDLGFLKFTQGNFNYELPASYDVATHPHVLVWCAQFKIQFGYATFQ